MDPRENLISFLVLLKKEIHRFVKVLSQTILSPLINSGLYLLVFGVSLSSLLRTQGGFTYLEFLIPGLVALSCLNNALQNSAASIMISKFHGDLQDLRVVPLSATSITAAYAMAGVVRGIFVASLVLLMGEVFFYVKTGGFLPIQHPGTLVGFLVLGSFIFGNIGTCAGFISRSFDHINGFSNFVVLPLIYLGGVFFSLSILHPFWQNVAKFNPLVYLINGIRFSILGSADIAIMTSFWVSIIFVVISSGIAWYGVRFGHYQRF